MGIGDFFGKLFGKSGGAIKKEQAAQKEVAQEAAKVIQIDEQVIHFIPELTALIDTFLDSVRHKLEPEHSGTKRLCNGRLMSMKTTLQKILDTKSVSEEYAEIRSVMADWVKIIQRLRTIPYFDASFADETAEVRSHLGKLESLLKLKKSILKDEFEKVKGEQ